MAARLFIVEDSKLLRERIVADLAALGGFEVVGTAAREEQAIDNIATLCPALVVTDLGLAEGSGVEVVRRVRLNGCTPAPRVFVLTNYADDVYRRLCIGFGAEQFFDKSTEYQRFIGTMQQIANEPTSASAAAL